jgi:hypothetical protein
MSGFDYIEWIAFKLYDVSAELSSLAGRIQNVPLLGTWLYGSCTWLANRIYYAAYYTWVLAGYYWAVEQRVQEAIRRVDLADVLRSIWPEFYDIRWAPTWWLRNKLYGLIPDAGTLISNPGQWVRDRLAALFPHASRILGDFGGWLRDWSWLYFQNLYWLWVDPRGLLLRLVGLVSYEAQRVLVDPRAWLQDQASALLGLPLGFWSDPLGHLWDWLLWVLEARLTRVRPRLYAVAERVLRLFWEGVL